jgi:hypothetical protein
MMRRLAAGLAVFALPFLAGCGGISAPTPPVEVEILGIVSADDEGAIAVDYDARSDGRDLVIALVDPARDDQDVASVILLDLGANRRYVFSPDSLGAFAGRPDQLGAVVREGGGRVIARYPKR